MQEENNWSPDDFMFQQFALHLDIMRYPKRKEYFVLSSGINEFPMPKIWKELMCLEIEHDLAYQWYTDEAGFPTLQKAAKLWENFTATEGDLYSSKLKGDVCMTLGASQAAAIVFDYIAHEYPKCSILQIGMNYPLFERLSKPYHLKISELLADERGNPEFLLPAVEEIISCLKTRTPKMVILTVPNNPTGASYSEDELVEIFNAANELKILVLVDKAGQMPVTNKNFVNVSKAVLRADSQEHIIQISSFSKTDSVPGLRLGYLMASGKLIKHCIKYQMNTVLNPQTVPVIPVFYSFLLRSIFLMERNNWNRYCDCSEVLKVFKRLFEITTALAPRSLIDEMDKRMDTVRFRTDYSFYCTEVLNNEKYMDRNRKYVEETLKNYITRRSLPENGFNFIIEVSAFEFANEAEVCRSFFQETGVALLTESCFRLGRPQRGNFWIRISLAAPEEKFRTGIDKLKKFIEKRFE